MPDIQLAAICLEEEQDFIPLKNSSLSGVSIEEEPPLFVPLPVQLSAITLAEKTYFYQTKLFNSFF